MCRDAPETDVTRRAGQGSRSVIQCRADYRLFRQAVELIEQRITGPVSTCQIASAMDIMPRMLQYSFQRHLDMTPMQYILHRKLQLAREALHDPRTDPESVIRIAMRYGITHLCRFSSSYRTLYGETPSAALKARERSTAWIPFDTPYSYQRSLP